MSGVWREVSEEMDYLFPGLSTGRYKQWCVVGEPTDGTGIWDKRRERERFDWSDFSWHTDGGEDDFICPPVSSTCHVPYRHGTAVYR